MILQENPRLNARKIDCALLPPCKKTLKNKTMRAEYVSTLWCHADTPNPGFGFSPENFGWNLVLGKYMFHWFEGSPVPETLFINPPTDRERNEEAVIEQEESEDELWSEDSDDDDDEMAY